MVDNPPAQQPSAARPRTSRLLQPAVDLSAYRGVWVFVEQKEGRAARVSWELMAEGRKLADKLGTELAAVIMGEDVEPLVDEASARRADTVYIIKDPLLAVYRTYPYAKALVKLIRQYKPEICLIGGSYQGRDLAGSVATELLTGLTADSTLLDVDPETRLLLASRPTFLEKMLATILCKRHRPQMATVRPRTFAEEPPDWSLKGKAKVIRETLGLRAEDVPTRLVELIHASRSDTVHLDDAEIVVSGGRGLGTARNFALVEGLADALGGVVGASRAVVDAGWISPDHQVGLTGRTVRPKLYVACGISGAIQHLVGMQNADVIIAINSDPNAPIFKIATYGILGDLFRVVPALTQHIREARQGDTPGPVGAA
ncbi:MAG: electron transfer flavoprotein subunit alpha/FixB family protein [Chloroflexi bacterium]|nr:electron transfer flavoprotein subunit alpha/FixB family protein [Chloroflexota bacterium]